MSGPAPRPIEHVEIAAGAWQLRPPHPREAEDALAMIADPLTRQWNDASDVVDVTTAREWCERGADWSDGAHATFSVLDATTGRLAGNISLWQIDLEKSMSAVGRLPDGTLGAGPRRRDDGAARGDRLGLRRAGHRAHLAAAHRRQRPLVPGRREARASSWRA